MAPNEIRRFARLFPWKLIGRESIDAICPRDLLVLEKILANFAHSMRRSFHRLCEFGTEFSPFIETLFNYYRVKTRNESFSIDERRSFISEIRKVSNRFLYSVLEYRIIWLVKFSNLPAQEKPTKCTNTGYFGQTLMSQLEKA